MIKTKCEFIDKYKKELGLNWLLVKLEIYKNSYQNYLKNNKENYFYILDEILATIKHIFYTHNDGRKTAGYRMMKTLLEDYGCFVSKPTVHKYMNKFLGLYSTIFRRKRPYLKGEQHKIFANLLERNFNAEEKNKMWCTDFTYIKLLNGKMIYTCAIIDLHDRYIVGYASSDKIDSVLAVNVLSDAMTKQNIKEKIILHSDQGSQFTSKYFTTFCKDNNIIQSMSRAGKPCDNAVVERFFATLKHEFVHKVKFESLQHFDEMLSRYINLQYNHKRPHTYNNTLTPFQKRNTENKFTEIKENFIKENGNIFRGKWYKFA